MSKIKRWFWIPARESENVAQTTFRVLGNVLRWVLTIALLFLLLFASYIFYIKLASWKTEAERKGLKVLSVEYNIKVCGTEKPIYVLILNKTPKVVEKFTLSFVARYKGRSTNIIKAYSDKQRDIDFIINPNDTVEACISFTSLTTDIDKLVWSAEIELYSIKFADL